ncbi:MAG: 50S ribosomal protein L29 [Candidatus Zambryskibacteria bacterium CG10_big_fil_rev_8_21_14_0_10_34_34]|uniref:Large ribosomal subunit protein uL29 n=1 Tax=Candidatus Zambryskibacteria bacterium CG10_big_fil_rev_8_21_14_0_10_34_34 TaxID=1975114 RepID=A0A2H0R1Q6_9BACT|nr:MAG: 50S ribosomal protein L29 [Candidatus Zambryskibacteria bacterium CG10_big_fil_rev_8_21_14_0_10_34_34]
MKKEISKKSKAELEKDLNKNIISLMNVRFGVAGSKSKNVKEQKTLKKDIARMKTVLNAMI